MPLSQVNYQGTGSQKSPSNSSVTYCAACLRWSVRIRTVPKGKDVVYARPKRSLLTPPHLLLLCHTGTPRPTTNAYNTFSKQQCPKLIHSFAHKIDIGVRKASVLLQQTLNCFNTFLRKKNELLMKRYEISNLDSFSSYFHINLIVPDIILLPNQT